MDILMLLFLCEYGGNLYFYSQEELSKRGNIHFSNPITNKIGLFLFFYGAIGLLVSTVVQILFDGAYREYVSAIMLFLLFLIILFRFSGVVVYEDLARRPLPKQTVYRQRYFSSIAIAVVIAVMFFAMK
ncbi:MAG: hypothetical protein R8L53_07490 [Mariprofundales bacterium]